ncbi:MAG: response regulator transcription factor [Actinobacteria bacterium]|nr:response regulator transcription factor [Actinomycetota bacterium]MBV8597996.1 response regulator transcription factor [Actinomycetota bacterium]
MSSATDADRVLIVDDDALIVDALAMAFRYEGFDVAKAMNGGDALAIAGSWEPQLIVLDWALPDIEGVEVGRRLRRDGSNAAILFLTARDTLDDKVAALRAGGDDYVTKPFGLEEIVARAHALLRRTKGLPPGSTLRFADLVLDEERHEVFRGDTPIQLTATEFSLLRYFLVNPRRVLSRQQIIENVWPDSDAGNRNLVETFVSYLRHKLDATGPPLIVTVRQMGYMLDDRTAS